MSTYGVNISSEIRLKLDEYQRQLFDILLYKSNNNFFD